MYFQLRSDTSLRQKKRPLNNKQFKSMCLKSCFDKRRVLRIHTTKGMYFRYRKVAFNIASEASYVYILSGQKFIKNAKNGQFWRVFENLKLAVK